MVRGADSPQQSPRINRRDEEFELGERSTPNVQWISYFLIGSWKFDVGRSTFVSHAPETRNFCASPAYNPRIPQPGLAVFHAI